MQNEFGLLGNAIAIVEDDAEMQTLLQDFFSSAGFEVHSYTSADDFLRTFPTTRHHFSAVISDVHMPGATGLELLREARSLAPLLPVLLMTAAPNPKDRHLAESSGAIAYLPKPFRLQEVLAMLQAKVTKPASASSAG